MSDLTEERLRKIESPGDDRAVTMMGIRPVDRDWLIAQVRELCQRVVDTSDEIRVLVQQVAELEREHHVDVETIRILTNSVIALRQRIEGLERERDGLAIWKCRNGGCGCDPPKGITIEHSSGGLFPQTRGWYAGKWGPYDSRHEAIREALCAHEEESGDE